jgi:hypothetical protein
MSDTLDHSHNRCKVINGQLATMIIAQKSEYALSRSGVPSLRDSRFYAMPPG